MTLTVGWIFYSTIFHILNISSLHGEATTDSGILGNLMRRERDINTSTELLFRAYSPAIV
jgi:hypothetical protein